MDNIKITPEALEELKQMLRKDFPELNLSEKQCYEIGLKLMKIGNSIWREIPREDDDLPVIEY